MKKVLKNVILLALSLCIIFSVTACGAKDGSSSITLKVWESDQNIAEAQKLCNDFAVQYKKNYPSSAEIKFEFTPYGEAVTIEKLGLYGPTGEGADVLSFVHDKLGTAVQESLLAENIFADSYVKYHEAGAIKAGSIDGKLYGYPITAESQVILYNNKSVTSAQVGSIETLLSSGKKVLWKVKDGYYSFSMFTDSILYGEHGDKPGEVNLATPKAINNITALTTLPNYSNIIMEDVNLAVTLMQESAGKDKIDAVITTPYLYNQMAAAIGKENVGIAPLPTLNGDTMRPYSGYKMYGVNRYSRQPALSHMLAEYLTNAKCQEYRMVKMGLLPTINTQEMNEKINKISTMQAYKTSLNNSIVMPNITTMGSKYWSNFENAMVSICRDKPTKDVITTKLTELSGLIKE